MRGLLLNLNFLNSHVRIHGSGFLNSLGQCMVMVNRIPIGLNGYLLLHTGFNDTILLRFILSRQEEHKEFHDGNRNLPLKKKKKTS